MTADVPHVTQGTERGRSRRSRPKVPAGLSKGGSSLWRAVTADYDFRADELEVLEQACRVRDTLDRIDAALVDAPLTMLGSAGQTREHPLLSEARQQRGTFARLIAQLAIPDIGGPSVSQSRSAWGRHMARSRWGSA